MPRLKPDANSTDGQLTQAGNLFCGVQNAVRTYEQHQGQSTALLHSALADLYDFGEMLAAQPAEPGRSLIQEFVTLRGQAWSKVTRNNPYNALVKLAFVQSPSSHSQYAAVLRFASDSQVDPAQFREWLQAGRGIKGRHVEALESGGSLQRQRNSQAKRGRIEKATRKLLDRPHSPAVSLPVGVSAPEGFALVLARIDGENNASIIDIVDASASAIEPVLLSYEQSKATAKSLLAAKPLGQLYRAIDLTLGCSPDKKISGHERQILIVNTADRGRAVCRVSAVSEAYVYPWAGFVLAEPIDGLPMEVPFILKAKDARHFRDSFSDYDGWAISSASETSISVQGLSAQIPLHSLDAKLRYRIGQLGTDRGKRLSVSHDDQLSLRQFLDDRKQDNDHQNKKRKEKLTFPSSLSARVEDGRLHISLPRALGASATFGKSTPDRELTQRSLATADIQDLLAALIPYETAIEGWFADTDVADAAICFEVPFDEDRFSIVLPTKLGTDYNQCCTDLVLPS